MKCVQSLWTGTSNFEVQRHVLALHTLSLCLANEHFSRTELVTDDKGLFISEVLGWEYSSIINRLDDLTVNERMSGLWARGKMMALLLQDTDCAHIDNDVLIFGQLPRRIRQGRLVAERVDNPWYYRSGDGETARRIAGLPKGYTAYNCGLVGGADIAMVRKYAEGALELAERFSHSEVNGTIASMTFEQYWLGVFARQQGVRVEPLLSGWATVAQARASRWMHLTGSIKHRTDVVCKVYARLKREFPDAHRKFTEGWRRLENGVDDCMPDSSYLEY